MSALRPIVAIAFPDIVPATADASRPRYVEVDPATLLVDESYQRDLSDRSRALIRRIVAQWDWRSFKPPTVVEVDGGMHVIDGQHTAIAAASVPSVGLIPVQLVDAPEQTDRARAFVRLNRDRIAVTPMQLHHAMAAAGDEDALTIRQVCERAGARVLRHPPGGKFEVGDTMAVGAIAALISRRHALGARRVIEILVQAGQAPIGMIWLKAVETLLFEEEYAGSFDPADLTTLIRARSEEIVRDAKIFIVEHRVPLWRGVVAHLYRAVRKTRRAS